MSDAIIVLVTYIRNANVNLNVYASSFLGEHLTEMSLSFLFSATTVASNSRTSIEFIRTPALLGYHCCDPAGVDTQRTSQ